MRIASLTFSIAASLLLLGFSGQTDAARAGDPVPGIGMKHSEPTSSDGDAAQKTDKHRPSPTITHEYTRHADAIDSPRSNEKTSGFEAEHSGATGGVVSRQPEGKNSGVTDDVPPKQ
jgi:hypothetical protein